MNCALLLAVIFAILQLRTPCCEAVNVTDIQLVDQSTGIVTLQTGLVQIQVDGEPLWGAICDDAFDAIDAIVVCRMLGFTNGGSVFTASGFPNNPQPAYLMDDTVCTGDEPTLTECIAAQTSDCSPATDFIVGVRCNNNLGPGEQGPGPVTTPQPSPEVIIGACAQTGVNANPNVRLSGKTGVDGMGFVEVRNPNTLQWGFVCDDGWSAVSALVVCRELCFDTTNYTPKPGIPQEHRVLPSNPTIIMDNVGCTGAEQSLQDCPANPWGQEDCTNQELAGVQCLPAESQPPPPPVPILLCRQGLMIAQFSLAQDEKLEEKHLVVYLSSGSECADVTKSKDTNFVTIEIPVDKCETRNTASNETFIVYQNTVTYLYTSQEGSITRKNTYQVQITCAIPTSIGVTQRVQPLTETVTQKATGSFQMSMAIYRNDTFEVPVVSSPVRIPLGEWLNMAVVMENNDPNLILVLTDCVTTPTGDPSQQPVKELITDKCPTEQSISIYPLSNFRMGFRFKPFKFVGHDLLYVHCYALVCRAEDNTRLCDRSCGNEKPVGSGKKRRKRALFDKVNHLVTSPVIILYDPLVSVPEKGGSGGNTSVAAGGASVQLPGTDKKDNGSSSSQSSSSSSQSSSLSSSSSASSSASSSSAAAAEAALASTVSPISVVLGQPLQPVVQQPAHQGDSSLHISDTGAIEGGSNPRPTPPSSLVKSRNAGHSSYCSSTLLPVWLPWLLRPCCQYLRADLLKCFSCFTL
ncbi:hypothetical protein EGW08_010557 [Elysia chlorotica]|uniref:ZP domain-containing protein n=1 Tax=Elysia chlorotica TaxID=188477 RepID=A0A3S1C382_ELYCH|nr:hypothetical protein EGW08_010557 [Elysia chlorotica]